MFQISSETPAKRKCVFCSWFRHHLPRERRVTDVMTLRTFGVREQGRLEIVGADTGGDGLNGKGLLIPHLVVWALLEITDSHGVTNRTARTSATILGAAMSFRTLTTWWSRGHSDRFHGSPVCLGSLLNVSFPLDRWSQGSECFQIPIRDSDTGSDEGSLSVHLTREAPHICGYL